jgi:probable HAF family extracellular repeat protein
MHDLGTLSGGNNSRANGVNADGSVVVGDSDKKNGNTHAFRWTLSDNTMHDLGTLRGGNNSEANAVNADGSVVVGDSDKKNGNTHAFRWTLSDNTMHDLGTLSGDHNSRANAVNADGSVVVGSSGTGYGVDNVKKVIREGGPRAFRWTQTTGMQSVEDWVIAGGGSALAIGNYLYSANGVSADGNVIVGSGYLNGSDQAFIARVAGVLGLTDFNNSLRLPVVAGSIFHDRMQAAVSIDLQNNAPRKGQFAFSSQGIYDGYTRDMGNGYGVSGMVKLIYGIFDSLRVGVSYIRAAERLDMGDNGRMRNDIDIFGGLISYGDYRGDGLRGRVSFAYGNGQADLTRNYLTGAGADQSTGRMKVDQYGYAAEIGYGFRVMPKTLITPMASYEWVHSRLGGYTENGGSFPAQFDGRTLADSYVRGGVKVKQGLSSVLDLNLDGNYVMRLSSTRNAVSGSLVGLGTTGAFAQNVQLSKNWFELRAGVDYVPEWVWKNLHLTAGYQVNLGQRFDVPTHRVDAGFVIYF